MLIRRSFFMYCLSYLPGLVVLVISMFALYSSLLLIEGNTHLYQLQEYQPISGKHTEMISGELSIKGNRLYWSVIALGLSGFVLVLLNSDKVRKLRAAGEERQDTLKLSEQRLAAMEASLDGICIVDAKGNLSYMNRAMMDLHAIVPGKSSD